MLRPFGLHDWTVFYYITVGRREFTIANELASQARKLANHAYTSVDSQADAVDKLFTELGQITSAAKKWVVADMVSDQSQLIAAVRISSTDNSYSRVRVALQSATGMVVRGEDRALAHSIQRSIEAYQTVIRSAKSVIGQIQQDKSKYESLISSVRSAISSASGAINTASGCVGRSDAQGAGRSVLSRARSTLPGASSYGESKDSLNRRISAARSAKNEAGNAADEAKRKIRQVKAAREAKWQREASEAAVRRAKERTAERARQ